MAKKFIDKPEKKLYLENEKLRTRLSEAEETLDAIRNGEVDAIVVSGPDGEKLYSLTSSETPYRVIIEEMNEGAATLTPDGTIMYCNKKFSELISEPMEQIAGSKFLRFVAECDKERFNELLQDGLKFKSTGEVTYILKDGTPRHLLLSFSPLPADMFSGVCIIATDITARKLAEEKVARSELQLKKAQQMAKLGSWEADLKTGKLYWSDEIYRIFGFDIKEDSLTYKDFIDMVYPDDLERMNEIVRKLESRPENTEVSSRIVTKNGRLKYVKAELRIELGPDSKPVKMFGSLQDITDIKMAEEKLRLANVRLVEAQKELVHHEKLAALGRFSSGIAHEIRNPLANISALTQLLSKATTDKKSLNHLRYIQLNADIANRIIKELLSFAAPEDLEFTKQNLGNIIKEVIESVEPRCAGNKITINRYIPEGMEPSDIDRTRMENALMNFVSNAIDAMPGGGNLNLTVTQDKTANQNLISISDTGVGIDQHNIEKIFEPFFTTKKDGTGLGLSLAYQTIKSHNGSLSIDSIKNVGTIVEIILPINLK